MDNKSRDKKGNVDKFYSYKWLLKAFLSDYEIIDSSFIGNAEIKWELRRHRTIGKNHGLK